ncbi:polysaccharide pyruvyl transferase family protein [Methylophaga frappieri]|nr:polysaccharide pyruvyl transferase family protein [Methylophaga frappieri]
MKILLIGQCTLHWGRMEFGNVGNYYIIEPFIRELRRVFPAAKIKTTMQMSSRFCESEGVTVLPMEFYYGWSSDDLAIARKEFSIANHYYRNGELTEITPFIREILDTDLVIDFSGDIWGDNADFLGQDRFEVGLLKDRVAQLIGKPVVMLAGSPGPFNSDKNLKLAKEVYANFSLVTNREPISTTLLQEQGFDTSKTHSLACPAFLFEPAPQRDIQLLPEVEELFSQRRQKPIVGFILCGWNFEEGPFDKSGRVDDEFTRFAEAVEYLTEENNVKVCLMSHSNGFDIPPAPFRLKHGRDYDTIKQLEKVLKDRGISKDFCVLNQVYDTWQIKGIVRELDMLVSGRVHAAVAALSQNIPTVIIDYGHEPKAHKLSGFAETVGVSEYVANPCSSEDLKATIKRCLTKKDQYKQFLENRIPEVKQLARENFNVLKKYARL